MLVVDINALQTVGLDNLTGPEVRRLRDRYANMPADFAREIIAWLDGDYKFDPACLTG